MPAEAMINIAPAESVFLLELILRHVPSRVDDGAEAQSPSSVAAADTVASDGDKSLRARLTRACIDSWETTLAGVACTTHETEEAASASTSVSTTPEAEVSPPGPSPKRQRTETATAATPYDRLPSGVKIGLLEAALRRAREALTSTRTDLTATERTATATQDQLAETKRKAAETLIQLASATRTAAETQRKLAEMQRRFDPWGDGWGAS